MSLQAAILAAMMTLPCPRDEPAEQCATWRNVVAGAIAEASERATCSGDWAEPGCRPSYTGATDELAAVLVEIGNHESGFRQRIQAGQCRDDECDAVRFGNGHRHLARSMWQIHSTPELPGIEALVPMKRWRAIQGTDPANVLLAATTAARVLVSNPSAFGVTLRPSSGKRGQHAARLLRTMRAEMSRPIPQS